MLVLHPTPRTGPTRFKFSRNGGFYKAVGTKITGGRMGSKTKMFKVRLTAEEDESWREAAKFYNVGVSELVRTAMESVCEKSRRAAEKTKKEA